MSTTHTPSAPVVTLRDGQVSGIVDQGTLSYRGIPFAQAPVGELRFRPPVPAKPWSGVHDGAAFGPAFPQLVEPGSPELGVDHIDEDALSLNVWTPAIDAAKGAKRPVMVWIHGGALVEGSARNPWYNGARLAAQGDVVVVTVQYRLGVFGFMHLAEIGGEDFADSGCVGLLDQALALRWVKDNIAAFGGDADNVTIFGESAGGASVLMLMQMPAARGLFHKVISQSPSPQLGREPKRSDAIARQLLEFTGVKTVQELQALPVQALLDAQLQLFMTGMGPDAIWPTKHTPALPLQTVSAASLGAMTATPLIIGTTLDELCYWTELEGLPLFDRPDEVWQRQLAEVAGAQLDAVRRAYAFANESDPAEARRHQRLQITGDINFRLPAIRIADALHARGQAVWMYLFSYRSTAEGARHDSAHAMELPFLFGNLDAPMVAEFTGTAPGREQLVQTMQQAWTRFAHEGVPSATNLAPWPRYTPQSRETMELNIESRLVADPMAAQRLAWADQPFDGSTPDEAAISRLTFADE